MFLQRYGEQSVRWQLRALYRCKNKCLRGVCFYSDMEHKSNIMIKNDKITTQLWSFKFRIFLAKTMISKRSKYSFQDFFFFQGLICLVNFWVRFLSSPITCTACEWTELLKTELCLLKPIRKIVFLVGRMKSNLT